jgi:hypothetical protein
MLQLEARSLRVSSDDGAAAPDRPAWLSSSLHPAVVDPAATNWPAAAWRARRRKRVAGAPVVTIARRSRRVGA